MKKRALVIGIGGLRGAYDSGVAAELCRELGPDYFNSFYGCSAGSYASAFFLANQPNVIENVWRSYVYGGRLVNFFNPLRGRSIFDLEYLANLFRTGETRLRVERVCNAKALLTIVLTDFHTGRPVYIHPIRDNMLDFMNASSALPFLHPPVTIDGVQYIDGSLSDPLPFQKALTDGHDEVVVVYNKPKGFLVGNRYDMVSHLLAMGMPKHIAHLVRTLKFRFQEIERGLESEPCLKIIRPKVQLPLKSILDTNKTRLNACVDMGIADAKEFLKTYHD